MFLSALFVLTLPRYQEYEPVGRYPLRDQTSAVRGHKTTRPAALPPHPRRAALRLGGATATILHPVRFSTNTNFRTDHKTEQKFTGNKLLIRFYVEIYYSIDLIHRNRKFLLMFPLRQVYDLRLESMISVHLYNSSTLSFKQ